jgi:hypothetical protein
MLLSALVTTAASFWNLHARAAAPENTIVYIECKTAPGSPPLRGSGVVISADGYVLTARHVLGVKPSDPLPEAVDCAGSIGVADPRALRAMIPQPISLGIDAALLQFQESRTFDFMTVCKVENWMIRRKIFVAGFPGHTETGVPSFRQGVLSTTKRNSKGILETDSQTIEGMSGGPVFSEDLRSVVGIVLGAKFTQLGEVEYYGLLPIEQRYVDAFQLSAVDTPCYHRDREVDMSKVPPWTGGPNPVKLGVHVDEGVCFLGKVWGLFNDGHDEVGVDVEEGEYVLKGKNSSGGGIGASARCIWYE